MTLVRSSAIYLFIFISSTESAFPPSLRYPLPISVNKIIDANVTCDERSFNATVTLQHPFKGLVFARDFSHECSALGILSNSLTISLPTSGCGIRLSSRINERGQSQMIYSVVLVAQQDRHLRQIADQERYLECIIEDDAFLIKSDSMAEALKRSLMNKHGSKRSGRMKKDDEDLGEEVDEALSASRAWMEITPEDQLNKFTDTLKVGESAILTVKSTLPSGIGWKVVECVAHDGLGDSSQKLLDDDGCPIDELLLPFPEMGPIQSISLMKHQEAVARFAAFKFPDRDRLHLSCYLELCRGSCPKVNCSDESSDNRLGRTLSKGSQGEVLDRLKVFNSVEVLAPAIDDLRKSDKFQISEPSTFPFTNLSGDRTFCVSPDKIAITFCILGLIFLCAVVVAACALIRGRKNGNEGPFYTRSLFSSSSGGSAYGSKLLLHESPCMGQSTSRRLPYGRIL